MFVLWVCLSLFGYAFLATDGDANDLRSQGNLNRKIRIYPMDKYAVITNTTKFSEMTSDNPFVQTSKVTHIRIHPDYNAALNWTLIENNIAVVHLATPINFDSNVQAVCLPKQNEIDKFYPLQNNSNVLLSGWRRHEGEAIVLRMATIEKEQCKSWWHTDKQISGYTSGAPYSNRICANASTANSHVKCISIDVGNYVEQNNAFYFIGFMNNYFKDINSTCTSQSRFFISKLTTSILKFIENNQRCGPHQFACSNGDCISLDTMCNRTSECADSSDEDPKFCRGLNYCDTTEFPCGVHGKCIKETQKCDGNIDCENGEDESEMVCPRSYGVEVGLVVSFLLLGIVALTIAAVIFWRKMKSAQKKLRELTDEEVAEFEHGIGIASTVEFRKSAVEHLYSNAPAQKDDSFAWDKFRYEIPKDNLKIDWNAVLGSGVAGVVYNGKFVDYKGKDTEINVAVKTFKTSADVENLKSLLSELKIMTKVGTHNNIVNLVGAYTREIKQRILYMALELCPMGSLDKYLVNNRDSFVHLADRDGNFRDDVYTRLYENLGSKQFTTATLLRWSHQIANGMEHLASRNITHGDIATRNVLLTVEYTAKISDFGLSRNLYASGLYFKKNMAPLPWRWMAPESLRDFEFSIKSDIWAYGVTLWEIYSLGGVPYPGLNWTADFNTKLLDGLRLNKPAYASNEIYNTMLTCWHNKPNQRPDFTQMKQYFHEQHGVLEQKMVQMSTTTV